MSFRFLCLIDLIFLNLIFMYRDLKIYIFICIFYFHTILYSYVFLYRYVYVFLMKYIFPYFIVCLHPFFEYIFMCLFFVNASYM